MDNRIFPGSSIRNQTTKSLPKPTVYLFFIEVFNQILVFINVSVTLIFSIFDEKLSHSWIEIKKKNN